MFKAKTQAVFMAVGIAAMALSAGCGKENRDRAEKEIAGAKRQARAWCSGDIACERGIEVGVSLIKEILPSQLHVSIVGDFKVTEVTVFSLQKYREGAEKGFSGISVRCAQEMLLLADERGQAMYSDSDFASCEKGAEAFLIELGERCGVNVARMKRDEVDQCLLKREKNLRLPPAFTCEVGGGRQCP